MRQKELNQAGVFKWHITINQLQAPEHPQLKPSSRLSSAVSKEFSNYLRKFKRKHIWLESTTGYGVQCFGGDSHWDEFNPHSSSWSSYLYTQCTEQTWGKAVNCNVTTTRLHCTSHKQDWQASEATQVPVESDLQHQRYALSLMTPSVIYTSCPLHHISVISVQLYWSKDHSIILIALQRSQVPTLML